MLTLLITGVSVVTTFVFAFAKSSSRAEKITESHRQEILARKNDSKS